MAKKTAGPPLDPAQTEQTFVELMMVAAEFARSCGGIESAKRALEDTGRFIDQAGSVAAAARALEVLENLKAKIAD